MLFDPNKMCWINRFDDEEDPFANLSDGEPNQEGTGTLTDMDATLGKKMGDTIKARIRSATVGGGAPSIGTPLETVNASPARSAASRASTRTSTNTASSTTSESDFEPENLMLRPPVAGGRPSVDTRSEVGDVEDDFDEEHDDRMSASCSVGSPSRSDPKRHHRGASTSPIPGMNEAMLLACHEAEARHRAEMKGWYPMTRRRALSVIAPSISPRAGLIAMDENDDDEDVDRAYLFEIRDIATRQY
jgi:hypothetical protein